MTKLSILYMLLWFSTASAAELPYTFETLNISIPGGPGQLASPIDINDHGRILTIINRDNQNLAAVSPGMNKRHEFRDKPWKFVSCTGSTDTMGVALIDNVVLGACTEPNGLLTKQFGFLKPLNGQLQLIDFPGADGTMATGRSADGKLVGQFYGPLDQRTRGALAYRFHCWTLIDGQYRQIDYPVPNTYVSCDAINNKGQILMWYITVTDQNEYVEQGAVIYDNGTITPLGQSFAHVGGQWIDFTDMNEDGAVIGIQSKNDGGTPLSAFLWDDGQFYDIKFPDGWLIQSIGGMNNKEQFVGTYSIKAGVDPFTGWPLFEHHGFVATPAPVKVTKGGK